MRVLCFVLLLKIVAFYWAESSPLGIEKLDFDSIETDLDGSSDEVEEEDLEDYIKELEAEEANKNNRVKNTGFKKKDVLSKGSTNKHNTQNLKKFFKAAGVHDQGAYDDDDLYSNVEATAKQAVGVKGNEDRIYRKGTKTRGFHRIHHKDEYKKDKTFYEDDETKGNINKVGAKVLGLKIDAGAGIHKGHYNHNRNKGAYGKRGFLDRGFSKKDFNSYTDEQAFDKSFTNDSDK